MCAYKVISISSIYVSHEIRINSSIKVFEYHITLNASNALDIMRQYP
jgi:hypothetical protein